MSTLPSPLRPASLILLGWLVRSAAGQCLEILPFSSGPSLSLDGKGDLLAVGGADSQLRLFSIEDADAPRLRGSLHLGVPILQLEMGDSLAVALTGYDGMATTVHVLDVANPDSPTVASSLAVPTSTFALLSGSVLYLGQQWSGIGVYSLENPEQLVQLGSFAQHDATRSAAIQGHHLFVLDGGYMNQTRLYSYDIQNPLAPVALDNVELGATYSQGMHLEGSTLSTLGAFGPTGSGLARFDLSDPAHLAAPEWLPLPVSLDPNVTNLQALEGWGSRLFIAYGNDLGGTSAGVMEIQAGTQPQFWEPAVTDHEVKNLWRSGASLYGVTADGPFVAHVACTPELRVLPLQGGIELSWNRVAHARAYRIEAAESLGGPWNPLLETAELHAQLPLDSARCLFRVIALLED